MVSDPGSEISILHVDDDPSFGELAATFLEREDDRFDVETATSARDGVARLSGEGDTEFECIVSDYDMPEMDGIEFLERVREEYPELPFILFTGEGSEEIASKAITAGATDYLRKEVGRDQYTLLANRIRNAVAQCRARTQRRRLETAIGTAQEGISILDEDGHFQYVNEGYAELYGYEPEELLGSHWEDIYPADEVEQAREEIIPAVEAEGYWHGRTTGRRIDGTTFPEDHVVSTTANGELICTVRDVTGRKEREQKLTRLHAATRDLIEAKTVEEIAALTTDAAEDILGFPMNGIHCYDEDVDGLVPITVSESSRELLGDPPVLDDGLAWETYHRGEPRICDDVRSADHVLNPDTPVRSEMLLPLNEHGIFIVSSTEIDAFDDADVTFAKLLAANAASALDRLTHAQKLECLQERAQTLMNTSSVEETAEIAVAAAHEILGAEISGFHAVSDERERLEPIAVTDTVREVFETPPSYAREADSDPISTFVWEVFDNGEPRYVNDIDAHSVPATETPARSAIIYPIDDEGIFLVTSTDSNAFDDIDAKLTDILASTLTTALQRVDRESLLRDRTEELERQNDRLEQFTSVVSHDLRNPLQVAKGGVELAREDCDSPHLDETAQALDRMAVLIDELLSLARDETDVSDYEVINIQEQSKRCWQNVDTAEASLFLEDDRNPLIRADRSRLEQLLENLFRNAVEHGGENVTVTIGTLEGNGFYIEDDGPGIPAEQQSAIFERGYTTSAAGTGLGLSIVREIATAHGWEITVTDSENGGARFEITGVEFTS